MTITLKVYKDSEEYEEYSNARFPKTGNYTVGTPATFEFKGHRWKYQVTSFDDNGDYDLLWRPDCKEPELMASDATLRDKFAMAAMNGILVNTERNQFSFSETGEIASKAYELADAMLKARG
ncbi:hypothetical protein AAD017_11235 [Proteus terrae]|uniref:hypothetical protein n=1 Tax=Proteus terrae TaxID=1574161 RepID=UPI00389BFA66